MPFLFNVLNFTRSAFESMCYQEGKEAHPGSALTSLCSKYSALENRDQYDNVIVAYKACEGKHHNSGDAGMMSDNEIQSGDIAALERARRRLRLLAADKLVLLQTENEDTTIISPFTSTLSVTC